MIAMGSPDELDDPEGAPEAPPTAKARNATHQEVSRLLDELAPERAGTPFGRPYAEDGTRPQSACGKA